MVRILCKYNQIKLDDLQAIIEKSFGLRPLGGGRQYPSPATVGLEPFADFKNLFCGKPDRERHENHGEDLPFHLRQ